MTPARLNEVVCPGCAHASWFIHSDRGGGWGTRLPFELPEYRCGKCGKSGIGWTIIQQSPPQFFLQPHSMYRMSQIEFDHWAAILKANFPEHPLTAELGKTFVPYTP